MFEALRLNRSTNEIIVLGTGDTIFAVARLVSEERERLLAEGYEDRPIGHLALTNGWASLTTYVLVNLADPLQPVYVLFVRTP